LKKVCNIQTANVHSYFLTIKPPDTPPGSQKQISVTKQEFIEMRALKQNMVHEWAIKVYGSLDNFKSECWIEGCVFEMPVAIIPPATYEEWINAKENGSYTDGIIEVENSWVRGFVLNNGHNRLKTYIADGIEVVKVKFIE